MFDVAPTELLLVAVGRAAGDRPQGPAQGDALRRLLGRQGARRRAPVPLRVSTTWCARPNWRNGKEVGGGKRRGSCASIRAAPRRQRPLCRRRRAVVEDDAARIGSPARHDRSPPWCQSRSALRPTMAEMPAVSAAVARTKPRAPPQRRHPERRRERYRRHPGTVARSSDRTAPSVAVLRRCAGRWRSALCLYFARQILSVPRPAAGRRAEQDHLHPGVRRLSSSR